MDILDETDLMIDRRDNTRPSFITVLCILTWIGSAFVIIQSLIILYVYQDISNSSSRFLNNSSGEFNWMFYTSFTSLICAIGCVVGSILMWRMKRLGYFIYLISELLPILVSVLFWVVFTSSSFIGASIVWVFISSLVPIAFIVMYSLNLKHLK